MKFLNKSTLARAQLEKYLMHWAIDDFPLMPYNALQLLHGLLVARLEIR